MYLAVLRPIKNMFFGQTSPGRNYRQVIRNGIEFGGKLDELRLMMNMVNWKNGKVSSLISWYLPTNWWCFTSSLECVIIKWSNLR